MLSVADKLNPIKAHCAWGPCWIFSRCFGTRAEAANFGEEKGRERGEKGRKEHVWRFGESRGEINVFCEKSRRDARFSSCHCMSFFPLVLKKSWTLRHFDRIGILTHFICSSRGGRGSYLRVLKETYEATCPSYPHIFAVNCCDNTSRLQGFNYQHVWLLEQIPGTNPPCWGGGLLKVSNEDLTHSGTLNLSVMLR